MSPTGDIFIWVIKITNGQEIAEFFKSQNYTVQKYNSKRVWLQVSDRHQELQKIQSDFGFKHNPDASGSSIGALTYGKVSVLLKCADKADPMRHESSAIDSINKQLDYIKNTVGQFSIVLGNGVTIENPTFAVKTSGTPKSDFSIVNDAGDSIHFSHKNGVRPNQFQQWSGITEQEIASNAYCQKFQQEMARRYTELPNKTAVAMKIPDTKEGIELKLMAVYGVDAIRDDIKNGINKVDCLIQGSPKIEHVEGSIYKIEANHVYNYPEIPSGVYEPVLSLIYKGDRSNLGIKGARASIHPIKGRSFKEIIDA